MPSTLEQFADRVRAEVDRYRIATDNPVHLMFIQGAFTDRMLKEWARQHWLFQRAYPGFLALLAGNCPDLSLRRELLADALEQDGGYGEGEPQRLERWEEVCTVLGLPRSELLMTKPLPTTEVMLSVQEFVARRTFVEGLAGLLIGVRAEGQDYHAERRTALLESYGVPETALSYFAARSNGKSLDEMIQITYSHALTATEQAAAISAIRRVLFVRWEYFIGIARACGVSIA